MRRIPIQVMLRKEIIDELEILSKKQGISRSRLIENILDDYIVNLSGAKPKTPKEKIIKWLLTGDDDLLR